VMKHVIVSLLAVFALVSTLSVPVCGAASPPVPPIPPTRCILAVLDVTPSYHGGVAAIGRIKGVVHSLGPGDTFVLLKLGGNFSPEDSVKLQCNMPPVASDLLEPARNIPEFQQRKERLDADWASARRKQALLLHALDRPWPGQDITPLYQLMEYLSHWLATAPPLAEKRLLLFTDLKHDAAGLSSVMPPKQPLAFTGVSALALFVPWENDWSARQKAWADWFDRSGAPGFSMLDAARSQVVPLLPPNTTPRQPTKTW
jgi:hypothetical protein